jgi:hypothetical protein
LKLHIALAGAAVSCLVAGGSAIAADDGTNPNARKGIEERPCEDALGNEHGTFTIDGSLEAWPPNHKPETVTFTLYDENDVPLNDVTIEVTGANHDEVGMNGAGDPNNSDIAVGPPGAGTEGSASTTATFLAERSGRGDGRVYTFTLGGTVDDGLTTCKPVVFTATVAHDQRDNSDQDEG